MEIIHFLGKARIGFSIKNLQIEIIFLTICCVLRMARKAEMIFCVDKDCNELDLSPFTSLERLIVRIIEVSIKLSF